ncbi:MAG: hypothetical protein IOC76_00630, partial [Rhodobacter sp.]|nr:hypothetical protein [Rhodobacter sp.]
MRASAAVLVFAACLPATAPLAKPGTPGPHYFAGTFERVGRAGGPEPALLDDRVT